MRYDRIVSFDPYEDGFGIMREAQSAKPQAFRTGDSWSAGNLQENRHGRGPPNGRQPADRRRSPSAWVYIQVKLRRLFSLDVRMSRCYCFQTLQCPNTGMLLPNSAAPWR